MAHYGFIVPEESGHFHPMSSLAREIVRRGHRATVFGALDARVKAEAAGLEFRAIGERDYPLGSRAAFAERLGRATGREGLRLTLEEGIGRVRTMFAELPGALRDASVDGLFADQIYHAGRSVAQRLGLPLVSVCNALPFNGEPAVPPPVFFLGYRDAWWARLRNRLLWAALRRFLRPLLDEINRLRATWNLPPHADIRETDSPELVLCQQAESFEFPRPELPPQYRFVGPLLDPEARAPTPFPFERLSGRPLVYASLGTLQTRLRHVYRTIAEACRPLDVQLVLSCGGSVDDLNDSLPPNCVAVPYAPQLELLARAALTVTHAGLNTTLESLVHGVPMVAIPFTNDQPGVAARIEYARVGRVVTLRKLTVERLRTAIARTLEDREAADRAKRFQATLGAVSGPRRAADLAETVLGRGRIRESS